MFLGDAQGMLERTKTANGLRFMLPVVEAPTVAATADGVVLEIMTLVLLHVP